MTQGSSATTAGQLLRAARLARGCDLAAANEGTKIPTRFLEALERDEYHQVSDMLYAKSFLRNYAAWLELDVAEVLRLYEQLAGSPGTAAKPGAPVWSEDQVTVRHIGLPWLRSLVLGLCALVVLLLVWFFWLRPAEEPPPAVTEVPVIPVLAPAADDSLAAPDRTGPPAAPGAEGRAAAPARQPAVQPQLPDAVRGDPRLQFAEGPTFDLVLRIRLPAGVDCTVNRDGQPAAAPLIWPEAPLPLPAANVGHGVAYAVRGGFVAYWGARDHFTVTLAAMRDVEVTLNGVPQPVQAWRPGQPVVLDRFTIGTGGDRP